MGLRPVQRTRKRYIEIAEQIRALIQRGEFAPGAKLPSERLLSERFGVGRSSVREALTALQSMGLIEVRQGSGARVLKPGGTALAGWQRTAFHSERDVLEARIAIERYNAQLAALRATRPDLARLAALLSTMEEEDRTGELGDETDLQFHLALAAATQNTVLLDLTRTLTGHISLTLANVRRRLVENPTNRHHLLDQHRHIFRAVAAGDPQEAAAIMERHLRFAESELERSYDDSARETDDPREEDPTPAHS